MSPGQAFWVSVAAGYAVTVVVRLRSGRPVGFASVCTAVIILLALVYVMRGA